MKYRYVFYISFILIMMVIPSSAVTQGLNHSRTVYEAPWGNSPLWYASYSGYHTAGEYTEAQWETYWHNQIHAYQSMGIDAVYFGVGTKYFQAQKTSNTGLDDRINWYGGDGYLNYSIEIANDHGIDVILWQAINKNTNSEYLVGITTTDQVRSRNTVNAYSGTTLYSPRLDFTSAAVRSRFVELIGWGVGHTDNLSGVIWEEPVVLFNGDKGSYGDTAVSAYISEYGYNPLNVYETTEVRLNMMEITADALNQYLADLRTVVLANTSRSYPDFVIGTTAFNWDESGRYCNNITYWNDNQVIDFYGIQKASLSTFLSDPAPDTTSLEYIMPKLIDNFPNLATYVIIYIQNFELGNQAQIDYAPYVYPNIDNMEFFGGHVQAFFSSNNLYNYYEGVQVDDYLIAHAPPTPTYTAPTGSPDSNPANLSFSNNIKKSNPTGVFQTYLGGSGNKVTFFDAGSIENDTTFRSLLHFNDAIPGGVTNATLEVTLNSKYAGRTDITKIELYNASNTSNDIGWITNHTTWNNYTLNTAWGAAGGDWYDANDVLRGSTPYCSFIVGVNDTVGTKYQCNITQLAQEADTGGINIFVKANTTNESELYNYISFKSFETANSSDLPTITFEPSGANAPNITSWSNNKTSNMLLNISLQLPGSIQFNATANQTVDRWYWSVDNATKSEQNDTYISEIFNDGIHYVSVYAINNSIPSSTITWTINVTGLTSYKPGAPTNVSSSAGIQYINLSWDGNITESNQTDGYMVVDEDTSQVWYPNVTYLNLTGLSARLYNFTVYLTNSTNGTTPGDGVNILDYPSINTTNNWYNYTSSVGKVVTIYVRAYNATTDTYSDWVQISQEMVSPLNLTAPTNLTNTTGIDWINWTWVDGSNYTHTEVWINGSLITNTTNQTYNHTGLSGGSYTIGIRGYNSTYSVWSNYTNDTVSFNAPAITNWSNTYTNNLSLNLTINITDTVTFNVTANQTIATWTWLRDGLNVSNDYDNYTRQFLSNFSNISVYGTNANGTTNMITWNVTVIDNGSYIPPVVPPAYRPYANTTTNNNWLTGHQDHTNWSDYFVQTFIETAAGQFTVYELVNSSPTTDASGTFDLSINASYQGGPTHYVNIGLYNFSSSSYDTLTNATTRINPNGDSFAYYNFTGLLNSDYRNATGISIIELNHTGSANPTHRLYVNMVRITLDVNVTVLLGSITNLTNSTNNFNVWYNWTNHPNASSVNVSYNGSWTNGSLLTSINNSVGPHGWGNVSIASYNATTGNLSAFVNDSVQVPNNAISISNISASYSIDEGETLNINADYTDVDNDTGTFADNSSEWNVNTSTGIVSWLTADGDNGTYYYYINVSDGYGSTDQYNFTVTINNTLNVSTPGTPTITGNTTGNFWVNFTFTFGSNTTSLNVSQNGTWINGSSTLYNNTTVGQHGYSHIIVCGYNSSTGLTGNCTTDNVTVPNNNPYSIGMPNFNTPEDTDLTNEPGIDFYSVDADTHDTMFYAVESNNQSANVTVELKSGGSLVDFHLAANWYGIAEITFNITDGYGGYGNDTILLTVTSVNDDPVLSAIGSKSVDELDTLIIDADATDVDVGDTMNYSCNRTDLFTTFNNATGVGAWTPGNTSSGVYYVNFSVDDGNGGVDFEVVQITVINVAAGGDPHITSYNNSVSADIYPRQSVSANIIFNVTADQVGTFHWYDNGDSITNNNTQLTRQWSNPGYHNISVYLTNINGVSNMITWNTIIKRASSSAAQVSATIANPGYTNLTASFDSSTPDFEAFLAAIVEKYSILGPVFFVILFGLPLIVIAMKQNKLIIPLSLVLILGAVLFPYIPEMYVTPLVFMVVLVTIGIFYKMYKERG